MSKEEKEVLKIIVFPLYYDWGKGGVVDAEWDLVLKTDPDLGDTWGKMVAAALNEKFNEQKP